MTDLSPLERGRTRWLLGGVIVVFGLFSSSLSSTAQGLRQPGIGEDLRTAITEVAKKAVPAVAHIEVTEKQEVANPFIPFQEDPFFVISSVFRKCPRNSIER